MVAPLSGTSFFASFGHPVPESILSNPEASAFMAFVMRWIGTVLRGGNLLTLFIAVTAWREGRAWAWLAMWYWPFLFGVNFLTFGAGILRSLQPVWVAITVLVLASNYQRFDVGERLSV